MALEWNSSQKVKKKQNWLHENLDDFKENKMLAQSPLNLNPLEYGVYGTIEKNLGSYASANALKKLILKKVLDLVEEEGIDEPLDFMIFGSDEGDEVTDIDDED
ncbi:unnamed protein product [Lepeophtheirus salmonis]|uniref:(salmon louse) hypothetical protein n=1 Tax=Lepeophtheirus salmonis TaxID=72036 RepID=A0A7R8CXG2_LEPSM|nr:unnamed protein product [Lepeophtheirus salmonis]CAF2960620.1 unnamed protein product [Lepeophtheirus salmonis]